MKKLFISLICLFLMITIAPANVKASNHFAKLEKGDYICLDDINVDEATAISIAEGYLDSISFVWIAYAKVERSSNTYYR